MRSHSKALFAVAALFACLALAPFAHAAPKQVVGFFGEGGTGAGEFTIATAVAINQLSGEVYVVDSSQNGAGGQRIEQFSASGEFIRAWGWGVATGANAFETCTTSCREGIGGSGDGQLAADRDTPSQLAVDQSDGSVYFADPGNNRVQKFSASGAYLDQFGSFGSGAGEFAQPQGIAVDPVSQDVYVADTNNNRIQRFDSAGNFISAFGRDVVQPGGSGEVLVPRNERQSVSIAPFLNVGEVTGGTFTLSFEGQTSTDIAFGASAAEIDAALEALSSVGAANVDVTGSDGGPYEVEFTGSLANTDVSQISGDPTNLTGDLPFGAAVNVATTEEGGPVPGVEVCTVPAQCQAGTPGSGPGELSSPRRLGLDSTGRLYVLDYGNGRVQRYSATGAFDIVFAEGEVAGSDQLAVDPADDHVYTARLSGAAGIQEFDGDGQIVEVHAAGIRLEPRGLAIRSSTGSLYAPGTLYKGDTPNWGVAILNEVTEPTVSIEPVTDIGGNEATFHGTVNPQGGPPNTRYRFEYSTDGENWTPLPVFDVLVGEGTADVPVNQKVTGLEAVTEYRVRLVAVKDFGAGTATSPELTFTTASAPPRVQPLDPGPVSATTAWLGGRVDPQNSASTFHVEYSTDPSFPAGQSTRVPASQDVEVGSGAAFVLSIQRATGLQPDTTYHYRVVATNSVGVTIGDSRSVRTLVSAPTSGLPDGRIWEKVSPADKAGGFISPGSGTQGPLKYWAQAAVGGDAVTFASKGKFGGEGGPPFSQYLARRGVGGWKTEGISARVEPRAGATSNYNSYVWFSDDLSLGILHANTALNPGDPGGSATNVYLRDNDAGTYTLVSDPALVDDPNEKVFFEAASADAGHIVTQAVNANRAVERKPNGEIHTLPTEKGIGRSAGFTWGVGWIGPNAISEDGSRIFVKEQDGGGEEGDLSVAEDGIISAHISSSERVGDDPTQVHRSEFQGASTDGSVAYFKSGSSLTDESKAGLPCGFYAPPSGDDLEPQAPCEALYRWDGDAPPGNRLTDLTAADPQGAHLAGVTAISDDGSSVYFIAGGDLAGAGQRVWGLWLWRQGDGVRLVAPLPVTFFGSGGITTTGDLWNREIGFYYRETRVTPDGRYLAFSTRASLTAYDTNDHNQLYLYDSKTDRTICVSCGNVEPKSKQHSWFLSCNSETGRVEKAPCNPVEYLTHSLSPDGSRIVFDSKDALVPWDTNGVTDVYQWQRGELHLLSSGTSKAPSRLMDASEDGDDVFFTTSQRLVPSDQDDLADLYDARVGGVPEPDAAVPCIADECQGTPKPPPAFQTPSSAGFQGNGNIATTKPPCRKGKVRRKGRCVTRKARKQHRKSRQATNNRRAGR